MTVQFMSGLGLAISGGTFIVLFGIFIKIGRLLERLDSLMTSHSQLKALVVAHDRQLVRLPHYQAAESSAAD